MSKFIPLSVPNLKGKELSYVTKAVEDEWVSTGGEFINKFEDNMAKYLNVEKAIACQSGTAALHMALILSGVKCGDEVIVPTLTFIAAVNPVKYIGANAIFMDCDNTLTMDPDKLEEFCKEECYLKDGKLINKHTGNIIKALVVVHVFGNLADMEKIMKISENYNLKVIEDSTEALGTYYTDGYFKGKFAGTIGDFGAYSFNGNKIITTGGGGMLISKDTRDADKAKHLSTQAKSDGLYYIHDEVGYNYRMTNLQAAMGVAQLERLEEFIQIKKENYELYRTELADIPGLSLMNFRADIRPNYWFYSLLIDSNLYPLNRDQLLKYLSDNNIQTRPIWGLISDQKPYSDSETYKLECSRYYIEHILNIPCSSNLTDEDVMTVVGFLKQVK